MIEVQEDGYYWKIPGTELWAGRFGAASFHSDAKEEVVVSLKQSGAAKAIDVTDQGGAAEFDCAGDSTTQVDVG